MADLLRPIKTTGTRRYQDEFANGQQFAKDIEIDNDLDTIYSAWNSQVPPAVIGLRPSGAAGGALKGTYPDPGLADMTRVPISLGLGIITSSTTIVPGMSGAYITVDATAAQVDLTLPTGEAVGYTFWVVKMDTSAHAVRLVSSVPGENIAVAGATPGGGATLSWTVQYKGYMVTRTAGTGRPAWTALSSG